MSLDRVVRDHRGKSLLLVALTAGLASGCATSFRGDSHFPGGPWQCFQSCRAAKMTMAGYVYVGEYSTACICETKRAGARVGANRTLLLKGATAAATASTAGVTRQSLLGALLGKPRRPPPR